MVQTSAGDEQMSREEIKADHPKKAFFTPEDVKGLDYNRDIGIPGEFPFTRGTRATGYQGRKWTIRQVMGLGTAQETNQRLRYLLEQGQTGISLTGLGYAPWESADERAKGLVGRGGVWVDTLADMEEVFRGIDLSKISVNQTGNSIPAFCMIVAAAAKQGVRPEELSGTIQNYVLPWGDPPGFRGNHYIDIVEYCAANLPRWNHTSISVRNTREAGISAAQEMAFGIYEALYTTRSAKSRGADINRVGRGLTFFLNAENDFLEEIAKFRAMRRLWARSMQSLGATEPRACQLRFHVQTSGVSLTAQQPLNNIVRATIHAMAAVLGGAQSMSVNAFDEVISIPSELAQTLSVRTQQIIQLESGITSVVDPLGGSYCIEALTSALEEQAADILHKMEKMKPTRAWKYITEESYDAAYRRQIAIDSGDRPQVGVNLFVEEEEEYELFAPGRKKAAPDYDPSWRDKQIARLQEVKRGRDASAVVAATRRLIEAYQLREPIIEPTLEAVEAYMSIGEIVATLAAVAGPDELRKRGGFVTRLY